MAAEREEGIPVRTREDPSGEPEPVALGQGAGERRIAAILDRWPGADHCYFRVLTEEGETIILRLDETQGRWEIVAYEAPGLSEGTGAGGAGIR